MIHVQNTKSILQIPPASANNTWWTGSHQDGSIATGVDTAGWSYLRVDFLYGASTAAIAELSLVESETTNGTYTTVTGSDFNVSGTLPSATDDNKIYTWFVNLQGKKRFFRINAKAGNAATLGAAVFTLARANEAPNSATERGVAQNLFC